MAGHPITEGERTAYRRRPLFLLLIMALVPVTLGSGVGFVVAYVPRGLSNPWIWLFIIGYCFGMVVLYSIHTDYWVGPKLAVLSTKATFLLLGAALGTWSFMAFSKHPEWANDPDSVRIGIDDIDTLSVPGALVAIHLVVFAFTIGEGAVPHRSQQITADIRQLRESSPPAQPSPRLNAGQVADLDPAHLEQTVRRLTAELAELQKLRDDQNSAVDILLTKLEKKHKHDRRVQTIMQFAMLIAGVALGFVVQLYTPQLTALLRP